MHSEYMVNFIERLCNDGIITSLYKDEVLKQLDIALETAYDDGYIDGCDDSKEHVMISNCCDAIPEGELDFDEDNVIGMCSKCKEGAVFED